MATKKGMVRISRLIVAIALNRTLLPEEKVHHIDGDDSNDDPENLMLFSNHKDHLRYQHGYEINPEWDGRKLSGVVKKDISAKISALKKNRIKEKRIEDIREESKDSPLEAEPLTAEEEVEFLWNQFAEKHGLTIITGITKRSTRERHLHARMKQKGWSFEFLLEIIADSPFLLGKKTDFQATFDWILLPTNYQKIIEGNYLDKSKSEIERWLKKKKEKMK
jgi:hypothetical protein